uniref:CHK kinase-like domain-containing protein n=1 Tax=Megaselia scalaris TaxID=36166 RepID=T1H3N9_MEGSC
KEYVPIFEKLISGNILRKSQEGFNAYLERANVNICVLNHGDAHLKNTMVKINSSGNVEDILWIDFQTCHFGPAVMDLMYFLYMSIIDHDTRINKREEIIYSYFKIFTQTLKNLGFDGEFPKLVDLYKDFLTFKDYELLLVTTFLPMLFAKESNREADPAQVMDSTDFRRNMQQVTILCERFKPH